MCPAGQTTTGFLKDLEYTPKAIEVLAPGMNTTVQVRTPLPQEVSRLHWPSAQELISTFCGLAYPSPHISAQAY